MTTKLASWHLTVVSVYIVYGIIEHNEYSWNRKFTLEWLWSPCEPLKTECRHDANFVVTVGSGVVITTTYWTNNDDKVDTMTTPGFLCVNRTSISTGDRFKVRSHMRGADAGGGGRKIGFYTNHYMRSHMRGRGAEAEREQNPLRNTWVPIFRVRFETARSKRSLSSRNGRSARVRSAYMWTYPR